MTVVLPPTTRRLLDAHVFAVLATVSPGGPQSSVIWLRREGDEVLFSTIRGRYKTRNMERDPRVSLCLSDPSDPYQYAEIRGEVTLTEDTGHVLADQLSRAYLGRPWTVRPDEVRLVARVTPTRVIEHVAPQSPARRPDTTDSAG